MTSGTGVSANAGEQVVRLARMAQDCGVDGVVCSPKEITLLRDACGPNFKLVVPGIRPTWASTNDQTLFYPCKFCSQGCGLPCHWPADYWS